MVIYDNYDIVFQEVPNEISLAFTIKNCPNRCKGCHSPHLRENTGNILDEQILENILLKYKNSVTCVLFLGGDSYHKEILSLCKIIKKHQLKIAMYSGLNYINNELVKSLNYYKIGSYDEKLGGLTSKKTNQKFYKINNGVLDDMTYMFWKEKYNMEFKIIKNTDIKKYHEITELVINNDGYCPCMLEKNEDTKCICKEFKEQDFQGECHCGRYIKTLINNIKGRMINDI
jgi:anaerobic ribonucleoside-triphosphate reductase activating protein